MEFFCAWKRMNSAHIRIPHLHLHLFPRYVGDMFENQPINPRIVKNPVYAPGEFATFAQKFRETIKRQALA